MDTCATNSTSTPSTSAASSAPPPSPRAATRCTTARRLAFLTRRTCTKEIPPPEHATRVDRLYAAPSRLAPRGAAVCPLHGSAALLGLHLHAVRLLQLDRRLAARRLRA